MKLSDYIVDFFEKEGINVVFGYIGGMVTHLIDSIVINDNVRYIQTYHEQTAAIAAEGYARESQNIGVAISSSGPGVTNMMTGIADAYFDSIPVLYITGQVNSYEYKYDKPIKQLGFQEMDVISVVTPITKYATLVDNPNLIRYELEKAVYLAKEGRKGPVLLDIPLNIQRAEINPDELIGYTPENETRVASDIDYEQIVDLIKKAKKPMILVGAGANSKKAKEELDVFIKHTNYPVITSLMGKGLVDEHSSNYIGMVGSYGNRCSNMAVANADLLIVLGSRLDTRQTGATYESFVRNGMIIHVDIDKNELENNRLKNRIQVNIDVASFLEQINKRIQNVDILVEKWVHYLQDLKNKYSQSQEIERFVENKAPYRLLQTLNKYSKEGNLFCVDIGQNQMWSAQTLELKKGQKFFTSGGLAPMGYSLPAAVGAAFANPQMNVFSINGDGGFHMAIQSLMLISQYNLSLKVFVLNNSALGMITQFQGLYFDGRMSGSTKDGGYEVPNIKSIAAAYNLPYFGIKEEDLKNTQLMQEIFNTRNCIVEYFIEGFTTVSPKLEYNRPIEQVMPLLSEQELRDSLSFDV